MNKPESTIKRVSLDILFDLVGCFVLGVGIQCFSAPNDIAPGGVTGIAIIINYLTGINLSTLTLLINIPLLILAWMFLGHYFTLTTLKSVVVLSLMLEVCGYLPVYTGEMVLSALYGGILSGIGLAIVFLRGSTTGGTDIASRLMLIPFPNLSMGRMLLIIDGIVLLTAAVVYRNVENALYGLITIFATSRMVDSILYGLDTGRVLMIISEKHAEIAEIVTREMNRGCTLLQGQGSYTRQERPVLMCAVRKGEFHALKRVVYSQDPNAFLVALDASEIVGEGFKPPEPVK